jgi:hypothetical protein
MRDATVRFEEMRTLRQKITAANKRQVDPSDVHRATPFLHHRTFNASDR